MLFLKLIIPRLIKKHIGRQAVGENGLLSSMEIRQLTKDTLNQGDALIGNSNIGQIKSRGNRLLVAAGLYHLSLYRQLRHRGLGRDNAIKACYDLAWDVYKKAVRATYCLVRPFAWSKRTQMNAIILLMNRFPFNEDSNGFQRRIEIKDDHIATTWSRCAVLEAIRGLNDEEAVYFFRNTWCQYDFRFPGLVSKQGYYEREQVMSDGDKVCDMKWYAVKPCNNDGDA